MALHILVPDNPIAHNFVVPNNQFALQFTELLDIAVMQRHKILITLYKILRVLHKGWKF